MYGQPKRLPVGEDEVLSAANPYGRTNIVSEQMIDDVVKHAGFRAAILRYFNPVGAHASGRLGEAPTDSKTIGSDFKVDLTPLITHRFRMDEIQEAYAVFGERRQGVIKLALRP